MRQKKLTLLVCLVSLVTLMVSFSFVAYAKDVDKLIWRFSTDPPTLDPHLSNKTAGTKILARMFEGLIREEYDWSITPGVAKSWEISEDKTVYTFHLRDNAKWSDGVPITTEHFKYGWKRVLTPEVGAPKAADMFYVKNAQAYYEGEISFEEVGFEFIGDYTIVVTLENPVAEDDVLSKFASQAFFPAREDIISANPDSWTNSPDRIVTNGPFKMVSYNMNEELSMVKDENYWDKDNKAFLAELQFVFIADALTALRAFEAGEIDGFDGIPDEEIPRLVMESDEFYIQPSITLTYFGINIEKPPLDNILVREALILAIDKQLLAEASVGGTRTAATGIVPFGAVANGRDFRATADAEGVRTKVYGDVERAREALAEAGYPNGEGFPKMSYLYNASPSNTQVAEMLQEMWKKNLNIHIDLENVESKVESERRHSGTFEISRSAWTGTRFPAYYLDIFTTGNYNNLPLWSDPEYDALVDEWRREVDSAKQEALLHKAEKWIIDQHIVNPLFFGTSSYLLSSKFEGILMTPRGYPVFEYIRVVK